MIKFLDGPAIGVTLGIKRAPLYLRVVRTQDDDYDALDQLEDEPDGEEEVFVYRLTGPAGWCHIDGRDADGRRFGRNYATGEYAFNEVQPDDEILRDNGAWREWTQSQPVRYLEKGGE